MKRILSNIAIKLLSIMSILIWFIVTVFCCEYISKTYGIGYAFGVLAISLALFLVILEELA